MAIRSVSGSSRPPRTRRTTVALPVDLIEAADREVAQGRASSRSELLACALESELRRRQREEIDADIRRMAHDPELRAEHRRIMREFGTADLETWQALPE